METKVKLKTSSVILFFILIPIIGSVFLSFLFDVVMYSLLPREEMLHIVEHQKEIQAEKSMLFKLFNILVAFAVEIIYLVVSYIYFFPVIRKGKKNEQDALRAKRRMLNAPIRMALIMGVSIVLIIALIELFYYEMIELELSRNIRISVIIENLFRYTFILFLIYYYLEFINRNKFYPSIIPENRISHIKGLSTPSVRIRLFIFFIVLSVYPILYFAFVIFNLDIKDAMEEEAYYSLVGGTLLAMLVFFILGIILTYLISKSIQSPLRKMRFATDEVRDGNYTIELPVRSSDELGLLSESINTMSKGLKEKQHITDLLGKVVDPSVRDHLLKNPVKLGGELVEATVLFSDIRGFTTLSETMPPEKVVDILNRYFDKMTRCINEEKGFVNKFIGDSLMAVFGGSFGIANHADAALRAALNMRHELQKLNQEMQDEEMQPLKQGIGIHTGKLLAGNIGSEKRLEYTMVGDTVNIASRLEQLTKTYQTDIIISEATKSELAREYSLNTLSRTELKGKKEQILIFAIK